jgi:hypothetical protein
MSKKRSSAATPPEGSIERMHQTLFGRFHGRRFEERRLRLVTSTPSPGAASGDFVIDPHQPELGIVTLHPATPPDALSLFCALCHALGDAQSWVEGTRSSRESLRPGDKLRLLADEHRAWKQGFALAKEVGFQDEAGYRAEAERALQLVGAALALPPGPFSL